MKAELSFGADEASSVDDGLLTNTDDDDDAGENIVLVNSPRGPCGELHKAIESASAVSNNGADQSIGAEENDYVKSRLESINDALEGPREQPELGPTDEKRSTSRTDEKEDCAPVSQSGVADGRVCQLRAESEEYVDSQLEQMRRALEDVIADVDSKAKVQQESGAHGLRIMEMLQPAFSDRRFTAGRVSGQVAKEGLWMIQIPPHRGFLRGK